MQSFNFGVFFLWSGIFFVLVLFVMFPVIKFFWQKIRKQQGGEL